MVAFVSQAAVFSVSSAFAQSANDVVGTWTLVSSVIEKDGTRTDQFGSGAKGMMSWIPTDNSCLRLSAPIFQSSPPTTAQLDTGRKQSGGREEHRHDRHLFGQPGGQNPYL